MQCPVSTYSPYIHTYMLSCYHHACTHAHMHMHTSNLSSIREPRCALCALAGGRGRRAVGAAMHTAGVRVPDVRQDHADTPRPRQRPGAPPALCGWTRTCVCLSESIVYLPTFTPARTHLHTRARIHTRARAHTLYTTHPRTHTRVDIHRARWSVATADRCACVRASVRARVRALTDV